MRTIACIISCSIVSTPDAKSVSTHTVVVLNEGAAGDLMHRHHAACMHAQLLCWGRTAEIRPNNSELFGVLEHDCPSMFAR